MEKMTHLSLFSGIGGLDLAAEWAGIETVGQCEWADFPRRILEKHWPGVPRWRDIRELTGEKFYEQTGRRTVDIISGGFPCQPFSVAGKQKGREDDRYLWPEMRRVITEIKPAWVVGENVPGILRIAAEEIAEDLERIGYKPVVLCYEAAAVGAPHRRARVAFVAHRDDDGQLAAENAGSAGKRSNDGAKREKPTCEFKGLSEPGKHEDLANTESERQQMDWTDWQQKCRTSVGERSTAGCGAVCDGDKGSCTRRNRGSAQTMRLERPGRWPTEPDVGRVAHGVPGRVDRIKALGNAVVPKQFYPIFQAIAMIERGIENEG